MKQVLQNLRSGETQVVEVPAPQAPPGGLLIRTRASLISAGTEKMMVEFGKASTSLLQRRLRIGYGRAAHLIDLMEQDGIVGAADGPKPREVLKRPDWISEIEETAR